MFNRIWIYNFLIFTLVFSYSFSRETKVKVAIFPLKPLVFQDENGKSQGFFVDLLDEIAEKEGWKIEYVYGSWQDGLNSLKDSSIDIVTSASYTEERDKYIDYTTIPAFSVWTQVYLRDGFNAESILSLDKSKVAIMKGDYNAAQFKEMTHNFNIEIEFVEYEDFDKIFDAVSKSYVDAGVVPSPYGYANSNKNGINRSSIMVNPFKIYFVVPEGENKELLLTLDRYLDSWKNDKESFYYKKMDFWMNTDISENSSFKKYFIYDLIFFSLVLIVIVFINYLLQKKIKFSTKNLSDTNKQLLIEIKEKEEWIEKAEQASRAKSDFLSNMSHEIRTPLNGIISFTELLKTTHTTEEQKLYLEDLEIVSDNLLLVINDILDISKIEAGKLRLDTEIFQLEDIISSLITKYNNELRRKNIEFIYFYDKRIPLYLINDLEKIKQIIDKLLSNAVKFTNKGNISLEIKMLKEENNIVTIQIILKDTGIGISKETQEKMFSLFEQGNTSFSKKYQGMGVGLVICKNLIEFLHGKIYYETKENEGTTFFVELPFTIDKKLNRKTEKEKSYKKTREDFLILVVDDNLINRETLRMILEKSEYKVMLAENGQKAVDLYMENDIDFIYMDIQMPVLNGFEATKKIREIEYNKERETHIVAVTAYALANDKDMCLDMGMDDYVSKPIKSKEIIEKVEACIKK